MGPQDVREVVEGTLNLLELSLVLAVPLWQIDATPIQGYPDITIELLGADPDRGSVRPVEAPRNQAASLQLL
jgi:hypothetical protein